MLLWIVHDHDDSLVVMVPLTGPAATETFDLVAGRRDVVDLDIEVDADFAVFGSATQSIVIPIKRFAVQTP